MSKKEDIDPIFFRKLAKVWIMQDKSSQDVKDAINKFAEFIDTTLMAGEKHYEKTN